MGTPVRGKRIYHRRSSAATAFSAIKRKFGYKLIVGEKGLSKKELMRKVVAYNLNIVARKGIFRDDASFHINLITLQSLL